MKRLEAETSKEPLARHFRFCDQLNDAALDAASDVAQGFVRYYPGDFARFLDFAISSRRQLLGAAATSDILNLCVRADTACRNLRAYLWKVRKEDLPPRPQRERPRLRRRRLPGPKRTGDPTAERPQ